MSDSRNSPFLIAGLFTVAAAIAFHAWWPSFKVDRDRETCIADCVSLMQEPDVVPDENMLLALRLLCESDCRDAECN